MNPAHIVTLLDTAPPFQPRAVRLLEELHNLDRAGGLNTAALVDRQAAITAGLAELDAYLNAIRQVVNRCKHFAAIPSSTVPAGF